MNNFVVSIIFFAIFISLCIALYYELKHIDFTDSNSEEDCNSKHLLPPFKNGDACGAWDGKQCRKGIIKDDKCIAKGNILPLTLLILLIVSFICFLVFLVLGILRK